MNTGDWIAIGAIANAAMAIATFILAIKTRFMSEATKNMVGETKAVSEATLKEAKAVEQQTGHIAEQVKFPRSVCVRVYSLGSSRPFVKSISAQ